MTEPEERPRTRLVWDLPVRLMHWALVLAVAGAWLTQELEGDYFQWHIRCGYVVVVIAVVRLVWGFVGTRYARFSSFVRGPGAVWQYIKSFVSGGADKYAGHNPLGALGVVALLALLLAQSITGLFSNDEIMNTGPLFGYVSRNTSNALTGWHERLFDVLLAVIAIHVAAAFSYLLWKRQNLIWPMLTGRKPVADVTQDQAISGSRVLLWLVLVALATGALYALVQSAPEAYLGFF